MLVRLKPDTTSVYLVRLPPSRVALWRPRKPGQAGSLRLEAGIGRAQSQTATWIRNGQPLQTTTVPPDGRISHDVMARPGDWFSLVVRDSAGPTLFSSAIYVSR